MLDVQLSASETAILDWLKANPRWLSSGAIASDGGFKINTVYKVIIKLYDRGLVERRSFSGINTYRAVLD